MGRTKTLSHGSPLPILTLLGPNPGTFLFQVFLNLLAPPGGCEVHIYAAQSLSLAACEVPPGRGLPKPQPPAPSPAPNRQPRPGPTDCFPERQALPYLGG